MLSPIRSTALALLIAAVSAASPRAAETNAPATPATAALAATNSPDDIVARGKNIKITRGQLDKEIGHAAWQIMVNNGGRPIYDEQRDQMAREVLGQIININVLLAKASDADKATGKLKAVQRLADAKKQAGSDEAFNQQLKRLHITEDELFQKWVQALTADTFLKREFNIKVSEDQAKEYYKSHPDEFTIPERFKIQMILIDTLDRNTRQPLTPDQQAEKLKKAEALLQRVKTNEDFTKLASEYTDDPSTKTNGGIYIFERDKMVPEVQNATFALSTNEVSDIVSSQYGYHIIKYLGRVPSEKVDYAKAAPEISAYLVDQAIRTKYLDYVTALRNEAKVEILDPKLLPLATTDPNSYLRPRKGLEPK
jgi:parvulin-like peptidyl-prolyl isomerase